MATHSTIALEYADGSVGVIYCHWDGYLEHNGRILVSHYSDPFLVRDMLDMGSLSSLAETLGTSEFHRDVGLELVIPADRFLSFEAYRLAMLDGAGQEYNYILRNVGGTPVWFYNLRNGFFIEVPDQPRVHGSDYVMVNRKD
jgi:hypothetical protein